MVWKEVKEVYVGSTKVRPTTLPGLCFTAEGAGATIALTKSGSPTDVTIEINTNGGAWSTYTFGDTITLSNVGDKVFFRNASSTTTNFSTGTSNFYRFTITGGKAGCSGDVTYLLNKNGGVDTIPNSYCFYYLFNNATNLTTPPELPSTTLKSYCYRHMFYSCTSLTTTPDLPAKTMASYCYANMFYACTSLTTVPKLPATTLAESCYTSMFYRCSSLKQLPTLPATTLANYCYSQMFRNCTKIKISSTQTGDYQTAYRIPSTGTGSTATNWNSNMFASTGGTYTSNPAINITYYTSNTVV